MQITTFQRIEADIRELPLTDQLRLMERLAAHIRHHTEVAQVDREKSLAGMAQDPDIQRELQLINAEFAGTEQDGLDDAG